MFTRILRLRLVRLLLLSLLLLGVIVLRDIVVGVLARLLDLGETQPQIWLGPPLAPEHVGIASAVYALFTFALTVTLGYGTYAVFVRTIERRSAVEVAFTRAGVHAVGLGTAVGVALILVVAALAATGGVKIGTGGGPWFALASFALGTTAAFMEELIARGIVLRILEDWLGTWLALALTAAVFGLAHHGNPGASWVSTITIALTAGLLLGLAYVATRSVWLAVGLHLGVNATQGSVLGLTLSGIEAPGLLATRLSGRDWLTGGGFGVEASVPMLVVTLGLSAWLVRYVRLRGRAVAPPWRPSPPVDARAAAPP